MHFHSLFTSVCCMNFFLPEHTEVPQMDCMNRNYSERAETNVDYSSLCKRFFNLILDLINYNFNQWGGSDSLQKSHQLAADLFSWFSKSKVLVPVEDLENLLHECMLLTFNTEIEDGSIEQVAEQLLIIHEEYLFRTSS
uniref:Pre-rRNA-processing protein TSR2 homolog n=1 Tax=Phaseolus vulgaris TaxID=3885 RepID=V7CID4_PHAVU|nr:hypothetical protein PHAVU_002G044900g [Phaseolus vulgaris]ESW29118.1 hypothetical protein PHAVU_002G044900g [Phaseolus vulgaris]